MHLIILPGNSMKFNQGWLKESAEHYGDMFESVIEHSYDHWKEEEGSVDVDVEIKKLGEEIKNIEGEYIIFAKSAGTIVTTKAISQGIAKPEKCVFVGSPWGDYTQSFGEFSKWTESLTMPIIFIQQTNDPFFKFEDLEKFLEKSEINNYELIEIEGDNHAYDEYDFIKEVLKS